MWRNIPALINGIKTIKVKLILKFYIQQQNIINFIFFLILYNFSKYTSSINELIHIAKSRKVGILHLSDMHISEEDDNSKQILSGFANDFKEKADLFPDIV